MTDKTLRYFDRVLDALAILSGTLLALIPVLIVYDAGLRILRIGASVWVNDVSAIFIVYATFLAAPWLLREKGHIYVNVVADQLNPSNRRQLSRLVNLVCAAVCAYLTYKSCAVVMANYGQYDVSAIETPRWIRFLPLPFGFALLALQFFRNVIFDGNGIGDVAEHDPKGAM